MPLRHFYDSASIRGALTRPLDPELHTLLAARVDHLSDQGLLDMSEIVVVDRDTQEAEIEAALGFNPLLGLDGTRWGQPGYCTMLDYVARVSATYHEAIVTVGNSGFAFQLLVNDNADPSLVALLRDQAT